MYRVYSTSQKRIDSCLIVDYSRGKRCIALHKLFKMIHHISCLKLNTMSCIILNNPNSTVSYPYTLLLYHFKHACIFLWIVLFKTIQGDTV